MGGETRHGKINVSLHVGCGGGNLSWPRAWGAASVLLPCFLSLSLCLSCSPVRCHMICVHQRALESLLPHERNTEEEGAWGALCTWLLCDQDEIQTPSNIVRMLIWLL